LNSANNYPLLEGQGNFGVSVPLRGKGSVEHVSVQP